METSRWDLWFLVSFPTWLVSTQVCCDSESSEISKGLALGAWEMVQAKGDCGPTGRAVGEHGNRKGVLCWRLSTGNSRTCKSRAWAGEEGWEDGGVRGFRESPGAEIEATNLG